MCGILVFQLWKMRKLERVQKVEKMELQQNLEGEIKWDSMGEFHLHGVTQKLVVQIQYTTEVWEWHFMKVDRYSYILRRNDVRAVSILAVRAILAEKFQRKKTLLSTLAKRSVL